MDSTAIPFPPPPTPVPFTLEPDNNHVAPAAKATATPSHPPYAEMIYKAIEALKEKDGSSKRAIGKYIEQVYRDHLPPTHSTLLTQHLKHLKTAGLLIMVKNSYKLPSSLPLPRSEPLTPQTQTGRSRPPKPKPQQNAEPVHVVLGLTAPPTADAEKTGPGRPPEPKSLSNGVKRRPGRPPKIQSQPTVIPFAAPAPSLAPDAPATTVPVASPRPRGRPRKNAGAVLGVGVAPAPSMVGGAAQGIRQGCLPKLAVVGRPKNPTGRPVGRPKGAKAASTEQKVADEDLMRKLEHFQSKVKESLDVLKPYFNHGSQVTEIAAIQELEILATLDLKTPLRDETQQLQQFSEQLPPPQQQLPPQQLPQTQMYEYQYLQIPSQPHLQQLLQPQPHTSAQS